MGIDNRDYGRYNSYGQQPGFHLSGPRSLTVNIILVTFGIYLLQVFTYPTAPISLSDGGWLTNLCKLHGDVFKRPWLIFEFLSYGFLHSTADIKHILFNMLAFWFFGRTIEQRYGRSEFLAFYLCSIIFSGLVWYGAEYLMNGAQIAGPGMLGASGGISAILILFAINYPHQKIYVYMLFPVPAWAFGIFFVGQDAMGAISRSGNIAYTAHLGGALFAILYYKFGWRVSNWLPSNFTIPSFKGRPKLRVHSPENSEADHEQESKTDKEVDRILQKINAQGQDSLTRSERRFLEKASKEYQRKRQ